MTPSRFTHKSRYPIVGLFGLIISVVPTVSASAGTNQPSAQPSDMQTRDSPSVALPSSSPGRHMAWVVAILNGAKAPTDAEIIRRFSSTFRAAVPQDQVRAVFAELAAKGPYQLVAIPAATAKQLAVELADATGGRVGIEMELDSGGLISGLQARPISTTPRPTSWKGVTAALTKVGSSQGLLAVEVSRDGKQSSIAALNQDLGQPIGSAFKLYVLGALARSVERGDTRWATPLAVVDQYKSLPSGRLQDARSGRTFPVRELATRMIAESDNTATDHLIGLVGRTSVERAFADMGNRSVARNLPLLSTRNLFQLKATAEPTPLLATYAAAGQGGRRKIIAKLDTNRAPLRLGKGGVGIWSKPREIERVEWFASPSDLVRAVAELGRLSARPGLSQLNGILGKNPGVRIGPEWTRVAFKGGSEPGVLSLTWRLVRMVGRVFALSMAASDPSSPISEDDIVTAAEGAIALLAEQP